MQRRGLVEIASDRVLELTAQGRALAVSVLRKHRIAERFLTDVVGLEWAYAHQEACKWEHVMSDLVAERLFALLGGPRCSPYGNPIPQRPASCGVRVPYAYPRQRAQALLAQLMRENTLPQRVTLVWVLEGLQATVGALTDLYAQGVTPGCALMIRRRSGGAARVRTDNETPSGIRPELWPHLFVQVDPAWSGRLADERQKPQSSEREHARHGHDKRSTQGHRDDDDGIPVEQLNRPSREHPEHRSTRGETPGRPVRCSRHVRARPLE